MPDDSSGQALATIAALLALAMLWALFGRRPASWLVLGGGLLPALLITWVLLDARARLGDLQLNLTELHFAAKAPFADPEGVVGGRRISIGSNADGLPEGQPATPGEAPAGRLDPLRSDDIVVWARANSATEFGAGFAKIDLTPAADPNCFGRRICLRFDPTVRAQGLVAAGPSLAWAGAIAEPFGGAARLCVAGNAIGFDRSANRLTVDGRPAAAAVPKAAEKRVILLRDFGVVDPQIKASEQPLRNVASYLVGDGQSYHLILADRAAQFAPDGVCGTTVPVPQVVRVGLSDAARLWIYALEPTSPDDFLDRLNKLGQPEAGGWFWPQNWFGGGATELPLAKLSLRRSLDLRVETDERGGVAGLTVIPANPDTLRIPFSERDRRKYGADGVVAVSFGNLGALLQGSNIEERSFASVGAGIAWQFRQILDLKSSAPDSAGCQPALTGGLIAPRPGTAADQPEARGSGGGWIGSFGAGCAMYLGSLSGDWAKVVQKPLGFGYLPFGLVGLAVVGLLLSLAGTWRLRRESTLAFAVLILLDFMLAMRQLVALEAAYVDPRPSVVFSMMGATVAALTVPPVAVGLAALFYRRVAPGRWSSVASWISVCLGLGVMAIMLVWVPKTVETTMYLLAWVAALGLIVPVVVALRWSQLGEKIVGFWSQLGQKIVGFFDSKQQSEEDTTSDEDTLKPGCARRFWNLLQSAHLLWLFLGLALLGFLVGLLPAVKRMPVPTAALVVAFGFAARAFLASVRRSADALTEQAERKAVWRVLAASGGVVVLALFTFVSPLLVTVPAAFAQRDTGFLFLGFVSLALTWLALWVLVGLAGWQSRSWRYWLMPLGALCVVLAFGWLVAVSPLSTGTTQLAPGTEATAQMLADVVDTGHFTQRRLAFANPAMMNALGSKQGEGARSAFYSMSLYANQGPWGRGYLNQPPPLELRLAHTSDYAAAVHLLAPFGRVGAALFLIVIFLAIANVGAAALRKGTLGELPVLLALAGLCVLLFGDLYMILANMLAVPFTGRNVYWLSPISISDLLEGLVLIVPAIALALGLAATATAEEPA